MVCTVAQGLMEKGRTEQFKKDVINSINMFMIDQNFSYNYFTLK